MYSVVKLSFLSLVCFLTCLIYITPYYEHKFAYKDELIKSIKSKLSIQEQQFVINNNGCKVIDFDPFDKTIQQLIFMPKQTKCNEPYLEIESHYFKLNPKYSSLNASAIKCCFRIIKRITQDIQAYDIEADWLISISQKCKDIPLQGNPNKLLRIKDEFVKVECNSFPSQLIANVLHSNAQSISTKKKAQMWDKTLYSSRPPSIMVIGVDSVSRLNMYRQLPKTRQVLDSNDFIELKGYHRVGLNTFPNMMALLGGMKDRQWPCFTNSNDTIDNCPFIWKNFSAKGYVTGFMEDAPHMAIFNYCKTGFVEQPTDYYLRPMFLAARELYGNSVPCLGSMNPTGFMAKYIKDFIKVNRKVPYFLFSWFTTIGHEELNDVQTGDDEFSKLLNIVVKEPNTVILFMSDHGMRYGPIRETFQGYYEESLPFLYLRLPPLLKHRFPQWYQNLIQNQNQLSTPLDIYNTMYQILNQTHNSRFILKGTFSLFDKLPSSRTCRNAHIPEQFCRCGLIPEENQTPTNSAYLANFLVSVVNNNVKRLIESNICHFLVLSDIIYGRKLSNRNKDQNYVEYIIAFQVVPGDGKFEGRVRFHTNNTLESVGSVDRIDSYASTADCINDWFLKIYCMCQNQVKLPF